MYSCFSSIKAFVDFGMKIFQSVERTGDFRNVIYSNLKEDNSKTSNVTCQDDFYSKSFVMLVEKN